VYKAVRRPSLSGRTVTLVFVMELIRYPLDLAIICVSLGGHWTCGGNTASNICGTETNAVGQGHWEAESRLNT
jgi:hypothetical protein